MMLKQNITGVEFKNPIIGASGTFGVGRDFDRYYDISKLGGISTSGITLNKKEGNSGIRIYETSSGLMNSIGLQNDGIDHFIKEDLPFMKSKELAIIANLGGGTIDEYLKGVELLNKTDVDIIELNISCPNIKDGGMAFGIKEDVAKKVVSEVSNIIKKPLWVKLSPNAENIKEMALACEDAGADGISLVNTFNALAIDIYNKEPVFDNITAGLSGPAIKPIALRMVWEVASVLKVPIIGMGGIISAEDVIEYIMAGATAVQVGTGNFIKPDICLDIIEGIEGYMNREGIKSLDEIRGII